MRSYCSREPKRACIRFAGSENIVFAKVCGMAFILLSNSDDWLYGPRG